METISLEAQTFKKHAQMFAEEEDCKCILTEFEGYLDKTKLDHLYSISQKSTRNRSDYSF